MEFFGKSSSDSFGKSSRDSNRKFFWKVLHIFLRKVLPGFFREVFHREVLREFLLNVLNSFRTSFGTHLESPSVDLSGSPPDSISMFFRNPLIKYFSEFFRKPYHNCFWRGAKSVWRFFQRSSWNSFGVSGSPAGIFWKANTDFFRYLKLNIQQKIFQVFLQKVLQRFH